MSERATVLMQRLEIEQDGAIALLTYSVNDQGQLTIWHTEVPEHLRGKGIGGQLMFGHERFAQNQVGGPLRPLVDPRAQESDLGGRQRFPFIGRRHFGIEDDTGHEMNKGTFGAVAGNDVHLVLAAFQGVLPGGQGKLSFGALAGMAFEAGMFEDRLNIADEINGIRRRLGQAGRINDRRKRGRRAPTEAEKSQAGNFFPSLNHPMRACFTGTQHAIQSEFPSEIRRSFWDNNSF